MHPPERKEYVHPFLLYQGTRTELRRAAWLGLGGGQAGRATMIKRKPKALDDARSMLDGPVLTLLIEAFALFTSTWIDESKFIVAGKGGRCGLD